MLGSFEVQRFRTFKQLRIERLGRVNLIVGRNNVGKTMLLEALRVYVDGGQSSSLARLLLEREELRALVEGALDEEDAELKLEALFHGRSSQSGKTGEIRLGTLTDESRALHIALDADRTILRKGHRGTYKKREAGVSISRGAASLKMSAATLTDRAAKTRFPHHQGWAVSRPAFLPAQGMESQTIGRIWDAMALKAGEERVIRCLQLIAPVERISLIQHPMRHEERVVMVRIAGEAEPVSLKSLGDGMTRVFQLALALEVALTKPRQAQLELIQSDEAEDTSIHEPMLLIDEVETGIHYSALSDVWRFLLRAARENDVQIFATTHSWDCIEAFQKAAAEEPEGSAMLIRLERKGEEHRAVLFDQTELPIVTKHHIEVR